MKLKFFYSQGKRERDLFVDVSVFHSYGIIIVFQMLSEHVGQNN